MANDVGRSIASKKWQRHDADSLANIPNGREAVFGGQTRAEGAFAGLGKSEITWQDARAKPRRRPCQLVSLPLFVPA
jgi:hypothetical protein